MDASPTAASGSVDDRAARDGALLAEAVEEAGHVALSFFKAGARHWDKSDGSPVTEADLAADAKLHEILSAARPDYGFLSEEKGRTGAAERTFVIDPIDGTRGFMNGDAVWGVVVAIVEAGRPVAAAIREPVAGVTYRAVLGGGAFRDGEPLGVRQDDAIDGALVASPQFVFRDGGLKAAGAVRAAFLPSLALRLARVADGSFHGAVAKAGAHHWDLAAADLLLCEAGGVMTTLAGEAPRYDTAETRHGPLVAGSEKLTATLRDLSGKVFNAPDP